MVLLSQGTPRHVLSNADPLYTSDGQLLGAVAVLHDITERKRIERLQREFISTVSHELRTPLTSITARTGAGLLQCHGRGSRADARTAGHRPAEQPAPRGTDRRPAGHGQAARRQDALRPARAAATAAAGAGPAQQWQLRRTPWRAAAPGRLPGGAGGNRRHAPAAGAEQPAVERREVSPPGEQVELSARMRDGHVRVSVRDRGPGISDEFRERVFQKFAQADSSDSRQQGGTGLVWRSARS